MSITTLYDYSEDGKVTVKTIEEKKGQRTEKQTETLLSTSTKLPEFVRNKVKELKEKNVDHKIS